ncbi:hypothetical protein WBG78_28920 [Chryseolinea sp. T2]|uniref:hypothetical protein n=1 Tax=Chryseolinea sp. T2 TaxID=3129255 RepID=UPI0030789E88
MFPFSEAASTIPKGAIGLRLGSHIHTGYSSINHRDYLRAMIGVSSNFSLYLTCSASNLHVDKVKGSLNDYYNKYHNHSSSQAIFPYRLEGFLIYTKWRLLSIDSKKEHFRVALTNEVAVNKAAHLDAFPNLSGDQSGMGIGFIATKLKNNFAVSASGCFRHFFQSTRATGNGELSFQPANSFDINLSFGYLCYPREYTSYKDINVNAYFELGTRIYGAATLVQDNYLINTEQFPYLKEGYYLRAYPGIQFIVSSKWRFDLNAEIPLVVTDGIVKYSIFSVGIQRYFYLF